MYKAEEDNLRKSSSLSGHPEEDNRAKYYKADEPSHVGLSISNHIEFESANEISTIRMKSEVPQDFELIAPVTVFDSPKITKHQISEADILMEESPLKESI